MKIGYLFDSNLVASAIRAHLHCNLKMFFPDMESSQETSEMINAGFHALPDATPRVRQPPAFLRKVYDIVSDPKTDSIISWDSSGTSLIVWDPHKFADKVLGKFFKHRNITTFVYQLNSYGFRRMDWERLEFKNEWFQKGKQPLLSGIKRRNQVLNSSERQKDMEAVIHEHEALKMEMMKLVRKQESLEKEMASLEKRAQCTLSKRRKTLENILQEAFQTDGQTGTESMAENEDLILSDPTKEDYAFLEKLLVEDDDGDGLNREAFSEEETANLQTDHAISLEELTEDWSEFTEHLKNGAEKTLV